MKLNPYQFHQHLINTYILKNAGDTKLLNPKEAVEKYKNDKEIALENSRFIWNENDLPVNYEEKLAKKYYEKLYREYCITDLSRYKENKIANRFRIEQEVISGKGQFICAEKSCKNNVDLRTWEINFSYIEKNEKKNALVKLRLCVACSDKLNFHSKKRELKRLKKHKAPSTSIQLPQSPSSTTSFNNEKSIRDSTSSTKIANQDSSSSSPYVADSIETTNESELWKNSSNNAEVREREEDFDEYLADLLM